MIGYLHGYLGSPSVWGEVDGACLALPGHGGGPVAATWDDNLAAIAHTLGPCEAVVGYSLGARVAIGLVVAGHVPRAVLISGNPGISYADRAARRASDARWAAMLRTEGLPAFLDAWEAQPLFATQGRASELALLARRARRLVLDPEQVARCLESMGLAEMPDYRAAIDDRFRLIAGTEDPTYVAIARALPAHLELIADAGHDVMLEQPGHTIEAIQRALAR